MLLLFPLGISVCLFISLFCTQKAFKHGIDRGFGSSCASFLVCTPMHFCLRWKKIVEHFRRFQICSKRSLIGPIIHFRSLFKLNGKYFLWRLYYIEFLESINQILNMMSIYLCTLPVQATSILCAILSLDALHRGYQLRQPNTVARRNRQVKLDMIVDFTCVALPLCSLWFIFQTPISVTEMIGVTFWLLIACLAKYELFCERQFESGRRRNI